MYDTGTSRQDHHTGALVGWRCVTEALGKRPKKQERTICAMATMVYSTWILRVNCMVATAPATHARRRATSS